MQELVGWELLLRSYVTFIIVTCNRKGMIETFFALMLQVYVLTKFMRYGIMTTHVCRHGETSHKVTLVAFAEAVQSDANQVYSGTGVVFGEVKRCEIVYFLGWT